MKRFNDFINEGVRDLMTPKSEEDIKNSIGAERYNIYKSLIDARDSIKPPFETDKLSMLDMMLSRKTSFEIKIRFLSFTVVYDSKNIWTVHHKERVTYYKTWNDAWNGILDITQRAFNNEISILENEISRIQKNADEIKELVSKVESYDKSINEGVRDLMTPIDTTEIKKKLEKMFDNARKDEYVEFDASFYFDVWEPLSEEYNLLDNYYVYKNGIYFLYSPTDDFGKYQLSYTYESTTKFKEKLEKAIEKINTL